MWGFLIGSLALFEAYGEVFVPTWDWPVLDDWPPFQLLMELLGVGTMVGILVLMAIRQLNHPRRADRLSRFAGSNFKQAYFVEAVVLIEGIGIFGVRAAKAALGTHETPTWAAFVSTRLGRAAAGQPGLVSVFAFVKLIFAMVWLIVVARKLTMGVAWHRFLAFFNIYFKREDDGGVALGRAEADAVRRQGPRLRGGRPGGRHLRRRQDRGLLLEGLAGLHHLHRVRPLPVAVPGLEHRQAAVAEAADHAAARPRLRQGAVPAGRRRQRHGGRRGRPVRATTVAGIDVLAMPSAAGR